MLKACLNAKIIIALY